MVQTRLHKHSLSKAEQAVSNVASRASVRDPINEFQDVYGSRAGSAAFRQQLGSDFSSSPQIQPPIQAKPSFRGLSQELAAESQPVQLREEENKTGLPDDLKAGVEALSGYSMDDVRVHYNSSKPAQLQALAYTQGTEIRVGPGHEKHLAHEAWHVVQQMQGRVKPTMQMKGLQINDDEGLEREADVMGTRVEYTDFQKISAPKLTQKVQIEPILSCQKPFQSKKIIQRVIQQWNSNGSRLIKDNEHLQSIEGIRWILEEYDGFQWIGVSEAVQRQEVDAWIHFALESGWLTTTIRDTYKSNYDYEPEYFSVSYNTNIPKVVVHVHCNPQGYIRDDIGAMNWKWTDYEATNRGRGGNLRGYYAQALHHRVPALHHWQNNPLHTNEENNYSYYGISALLN
ncbi:MAG: DUF4157 domain-containing protein [Dolichospermum sp.]|jgi:hypothetical protein|nr:DUF4157 domain-containing protein [Anabaena sp. 49628_E55]